MEYSSKTKQALLTAIVLIIMVSVACVILFLNIKEKNNNISVLTNEVDSILQKEIKLRSVKYLINDTQQEREELDLYFVADDEVINFIEIIEDLGVDSGVSVEITNVSIDDKNIGAADRTKISELFNLEFKTEGRFDEIFYFLSMIEKLPFKIDILRVNFEKILDDDKGIDKSLEPWKGSFRITVVKLK